MRTWQHSGKADDVCGKVVDFSRAGAANIFRHGEEENRFVMKRGA